MKATLELRIAQLDCADEARQIESALARLDGIGEVRTAVSSGTAVVAYDPHLIRPEAIRAAIADLGMTVTEGQAPEAVRRRSLPDLLGWAFVSAVAVVAILGIVAERLGLVEVLARRIPAWISIPAVLAGGYPIFRSVVRALRNRTVSSHALMTLGILGALTIGQYSAAAVIVCFMRFADFVAGFTTERSRRAIKELLKLAPETARVEREGAERELPADQVVRGDVVLVKPGERIPVDGVVLDGSAAVNQAPITGESVPVEKHAGNQVFAASICERGALKIFTERVGPDTTFGQIIPWSSRPRPPRRRSSASPTDSPRTTFRWSWPSPSVRTSLVGARRRQWPPCSSPARAPLQWPHPSRSWRQSAGRLGAGLSSRVGAIWRRSPRPIRS